MTKFFKLALIASASLLAITQAQAADVPAPAGCSVMGIISAGGIYDWQNFKTTDGEGFDHEADQTWRGGFGDGAVGLTCDAWNVQVDAAMYGFYGSEPWNFGEGPNFKGPIAASGDAAFKSVNGHIGGAAFTRNDQFALGVSGSLVIQNDGGSGLPFSDYDYGFTTHTFRVGAFGEVFAGDKLTLGASVHYFNGEVPGVTTTGDQHGFEFTGVVKLYATDNLAFTLQGDASTSKESYFVWGDTYDYDNKGYAATVEAEYKIATTPLSVFAGGRWASRQSKSTSDNDGQYDYIDKQIFAGLKLDLGGSKNTSLAMRDRTGTYDNTSTLLEKLPTLNVSLDRAFFNKR
jgi:hypothetical protein